MASPPYKPGNPVSIPLLLFSTAVAGSGPWTISEGDTSVYLGVESQRLERLTQSSGAGGDDVLDVDDGLETTGFKAVVTHGVREDIEVELDVGWFRVEANRPRFLPYNMSRVRRRPLFLVKLYLRLPFAWSLFGHQFFLAARKP